MSLEIFFFSYLILNRKNFHKILTNLKNAKKVNGNKSNCVLVPLKYLFVNCNFQWNVFIILKWLMYLIIILKNIICIKWGLHRSEKYFKCFTIFFKKCCSGLIMQFWPFQTWLAKSMFLFPRHRLWTHKLILIKYIYNQSQQSF